APYHFESAWNALCLARNLQIGVDQRLAGTPRALEPAVPNIVHGLVSLGVPCTAWQIASLRLQEDGKWLRPCIDHWSQNIDSGGQPASRCPQLGAWRSGSSGGDVLRHRVVGLGGMKRQSDLRTRALSPRVNDA